MSRKNIYTPRKIGTANLIQQVHDLQIENARLVRDLEILQERCDMLTRELGTRV